MQRLRVPGATVIALLLMVSAVGFAIIGTSHPVAAAAASKVYWLQPSLNGPGTQGKLVQHPSKISLSDLGLTKLRWQHWGTAVATATGRASVNTCDPDCAAANYANGPTKIKMSRLERIAGHRQYTCMSGTAAGDRIQWGDGCRVGASGARATEAKVCNHRLTEYIFISFMHTTCATARRVARGVQEARKLPARVRGFWCRALDVQAAGGGTLCTSGRREVRLFYE